jgi:hypothetical protein
VCSEAGHRASSRAAEPPRQSPAPKGQLAAFPRAHDALRRDGGADTTLEAVAREALWEESGGPPISGPPQQRGFGTRLLESGLAAQIGGRVSIDFAATGLRCRIRVPGAAESRADRKPLRVRHAKMPLID